MDKISLYLLNRLKFIGNYEFETRNNKLYINGYEIEKINDNSKFHSIKVITYTDTFDCFKIEELLDLTTEPKILINLFKCFKKFFDSGYSKDFMSGDYGTYDVYESRRRLKRNIKKLDEDIDEYYLYLITTESLISFIIQDDKNIRIDKRTLFTYKFSINLIKINHDWRIEINFRNSVLNPNYLNIFSKIKGRKIYDIYLDIYPIEKINNKLFINNQEFTKIENYKHINYQLKTTYESKEFSSKDLYKYEDLLVNDWMIYGLLRLVDRVIKSGLLDQINKNNYIRILSKWLKTKYYDDLKLYTNAIYVEHHGIYYQILITVNSKILNLFEIKFFNLCGWDRGKNCIKLIKNNDGNYIEICFGYYYIRSEWKKIFSRLKFDYEHKKSPLDIKNELALNFPIENNEINGEIYDICYTSENYKDLIIQFDKFIDQKISFLFIDGVDKLFETFINKFRIILEVDQMEEVLSNKNPCDSDINKRMKIISDYLSKINFDHELIKGDKYNEIEIPLESDNDIDIITLTQDDSIDYICLLFELEIYINKFNFRIEFKYFKNSYEINIKFDGRFISKFIKK